MDRDVDVELPPGRGSVLGAVDGEVVADDVRLLEGETGAGVVDAGAVVVDDFVLDGDSLGVVDGERGAVDVEEVLGVECAVRCGAS